MNKIDSINYPIYFNNLTTGLDEFITAGKYSRFFILIILIKVAQVGYFFFD